MKALSRRVLAVATATVLGVPLLATAPAQADDPVVLNLIGINDFHGRIDANTVKFAGTVEQLRQDGGDANSLLISAGDNVSASLFASSVQKDKPTIDVLNALQLDASAAGNHEFDQGADDLTGRLSELANFPFLSANTFKADNSPLLDKYKIFTIDGVDVAVVGAVTQETPSLVSPGGIQGLTFQDPTDAINDTVDELEALADPPDVIVASIHEGADGSKTLEQNVAASPVFKKIVEQTDPAVDAIFMGHTHQAYAYDAPIPGAGGKTRPILQTGNYGTNVGQIKLTFDKDSGDVTGYTKKNQARTTTADGVLVDTYPRVAAVKPIVDNAIAFAAEKGNAPVAEQTADITRAGGPADDRASESSLGNLVADAFLAQVKKTPAGADIGLNNSGGLRADLLYKGTTGTNQDGVLTYAEALSVLTFANQLSSVTVTGSTLKKVLEQQWQTTLPPNPPPTRPYLQLGMSKNMSYTFDPSRPQGDRITSITINGALVKPSDTFKAALPTFLTTGGDNFRAFTEGTAVDTGLVDYQAFVDYLTESSPVSPSPLKHAVQTTGVKKQYRVGGNVSFTLSKLDLTSLGSPANTSVSSKLFYGDGKSVSLGSKSVTGGTSAPIAFTLPAGESGAMRVESTAFPSGSKVVVPLDVTGATVTGSPAEGTYGDDVEVGVDVTGPEETPTGTVTLKDGDQVVGTGALANGKATITVDTEDIGAGVNDLTVAYAGDSSYSAANGTVKVTVAKAGTTASAEAPDPVAISSDAEIKTAVASATGTTPTGTVTVSDGDTALGSQELGEGKATVTTDVSGLSIGSHTLTVAYSGDANHEASTSTVVVKVFKGTTELDVTVDPSPYGTSAVLEVKGDPGASGLVHVGEGDQSVGVGFMRDGVAKVLLDKTLAVGTHQLDVYYGGSSTFDATQTTAELEVTKAATTITMTKVYPTSIIKNRTKPFVYVSVKAAGVTVDGGTVTLRQSGRSYTGTVVGGKVRIKLGVFATSGTGKTIPMSYSGNESFLPSRSSFTVKVLSR
ncbi:Ig-like domain repeat protein [Aeromicrobium sp. NPDC092404]|uniref:Ig-like domain repeat protein n=1 Tax=Aeromicrobium sp. NPDC092404 TaxID=3154976 RepID=UPI0034238B79